MKDDDGGTERMDPQGTDLFIAFLIVALIAGVILALTL